MGEGTNEKKVTGKMEPVLSKRIVYNKEERWELGYQMFTLDHMSFEISVSHPS